MMNFNLSTSNNDCLKFNIAPVHMESEPVYVPCVSDLNEMQTEESDLAFERKVEESRRRFKKQVNDYIKKLREARKIEPKHLVPKYHGKPDENLVLWFQEVKHASDLCNWSEEEKLQYTKLLLGGQTRSVVMGKIFEDFKDLIQELINNFLPSNTYEMYREKLQRAKMREGKSVQYFLF